MSKWSKDIPTETGFYWWRNLLARYEDDRGPFIHEVRSLRSYGGELVVGHCRIKGSYFERGEWQKVKEAED